MKVFLDPKPSRAEDYLCVQRGGEPHPGHSCLLPDGMHVVFCRKLHLEEWAEFGRRLDEVWDRDHAQWELEGMVKLMEEIAGVHPIRIEYLYDAHGREV